MSHGQTQDAARRVIVHAILRQPQRTEFTRRDLRDRTRFPGIGWVSWGTVCEVTTALVTLGYLDDVPEPRLPGRAHLYRVARRVLPRDLDGIADAVIAARPRQHPPLRCCPHCGGSLPERV